MDQLVAKPEHLIGISTGFSLAAFKAMYDGITKTAGKAPEVVICGSQALAEDAYSASEILGYALAFIVDDELGPKRIWLTNLEALDHFPGGRK